MRILIACEYSATVRDAFRKFGHDAWSCNILPSDGDPAYHIQGDAIEVAYGQHWDMMIAHPPCTWLCNAQRTNAARKDRPNITRMFLEERKKGYDFFMKLYNAPIHRIAVENPVGYVNSVFRKADQVIYPWQYGHGYKKAYCLWTKNLPKLSPTNIVEGRKILDFWSTKRNPDGRSIKSKTFQGIADAMATQWGNIQ